MRTKEYIETCEICHKTYVATRKGSTVCSNVCRAQKSRNKHSKTFKTQKEIINTQAKVINATFSKPKVNANELLPNSKNSGDLEGSDIKTLSYSRDYDKIQSIIKEINQMVREAEARAERAGVMKELWFHYVSDNNRIQELCQMIQYLR